MSTAIADTDTGSWFPVPDEADLPSGLRGLFASASYYTEGAVVRQYLTPSAQKAWNPGGAVTVSQHWTVNPPVFVTAPPSLLVTVMLRAPVVAPDAIVMLAVSDVALTNVVEFTVIPVPENATVAPDTNPVPVTVMFWLVAP